MNVFYYDILCYLQLPLALLGYGIGASAQEMANNYIGNLYAIARKEFNVPEGLPIKNEMLLTITWKNSFSHVC